MGDMHLSSCDSWIGLALAGLVSVGLCVASLGVWLCCVGSDRLVESREGGVLKLRLGLCATVYMRPRFVLCCRSCTRRPLSNACGQVLMWCREPHTCIRGTETVEAHGNSFAPLRKKSQMQSSTPRVSERAPGPVPCSLWCLHVPRIPRPCTLRTTISLSHPSGDSDEFGTNRVQTFVSPKQMLRRALADGHSWCRWGLQRAGRGERPRRFLPVQHPQSGSSPPPSVQQRRESIRWTRDLVKKRCLSPYPPLGTQGGGQ